MLRDQCIFRVIKQNVWIGAKERSKERKEASISSPRVIVWCAIYKARIIGPFFFVKGSIIGATYRNMIIRCTFRQFSALREDYSFMQDSAPLHYLIPVRKFYDRKRLND